MTRLRFLLAAVAAVSAFAAILVAGQAGTQDASSEKVLPVLSTSDVIGYTSPCG